ncbi:MAG: hypothetical protein GF341_05490 [candidate division Zixibacteria bacterium]|nr:hypothetical protein [candidate division Zixibacteria bacterium]
MTTVDETKSQTAEMTDEKPAAQTATRKTASTSSKKRRSTKKPAAPTMNEAGPFEVRVDDTGTVMPSFWRFGE